jgi:hypothetical protein
LNTAEDAKAVVETDEGVLRQSRGVETTVHFARAAFVDALGRVQSDGFMVTARRTRRGRSCGI